MKKLSWLIAFVVPGTDVLAGIPEIPVRIHGHDYRRAAFGESWTDDNTAPDGHNGCDTRNDILNPYTNDVMPLSEAGARS